MYITRLVIITVAYERYHFYTCAVCDIAAISCSRFVGRIRRLARLSVRPFVYLPIYTVGAANMRTKGIDPQIALYVLNPDHV